MFDPAEIVIPVRTVNVTIEGEVDTAIVPVDPSFEELIRSPRRCGEKAMPSRFIVQEQDDQLARTINREARSDPASPYAGKFVAIGRGKVIAIVDSLDEAVTALRQALPKREEGLVIEASADYEGPHEIWTS